MSATEHIRRLVLQFLKAAAPHALPETELMARVEARNGRPIGVHDFTIHVGWLWEHKLTQKMDGDFGDKEARWIITKAGENYLMR